MRERAEPILKIVCGLLGAFLAIQCVLAVVRSNPLARAKIPGLPSLSVDTNAPAAVKTAGGMASPLSASAGTNPPAKAQTNLNVANAAVADTNAAVRQNSSVLETNVVNVPAQAAPVRPEKSATNGPAGLESGNAATNSVSTNSLASARPPKKAAGPEMAMMAMNSPPKKLPELPPAAKARVDRIAESEILGPMVRPQPMALLGIAGNSAFLRSASGQTGLVKEGDSLGELKLLQIGMNRVLVEENGQKKELTMFSGYGSESLLPEPKESPDETKSK